MGRHNHKLAARAARLLATAAFLIAALVFLGWALELPAIRTFLLGGASMKANAAVGILLLSASVWLFGSSQTRFIRWSVSAFSLTAGLIGGLTLIQYLFGVNFGIDELLFEESPLVAGTSHPGRMAPNAALNLVVLGFAATLLFAGRLVRTAQILSLVSGLDSFLALISYMYGVESFYGLAHLTQMSLPTSLAFILLAAGIFLVVPGRGLASTLVEETLGGTALRGLLPAAVVLPPVIGFLTIVGYRLGLYGIQYALTLFTGGSVLALVFVIAINAKSIRTLDLEQRASRRALHRKAQILKTVNQINTTISSKLDLQDAIQTVTDAAKELSGAEFGAFFYNVENEEGKSYMLYTLSGAPREAFEHFPIPRNTGLFGPTFPGEKTIRIENVTEDPHCGDNPPHLRTPEGRLPVLSYLAVPVVSGSGKVIGGLFFGHSQPGVFTEESGNIVEAIAVQAAIAFDNARVYEQLQRELQLRTKTEAAFQKLNERLEQEVAERTAVSERRADQLRILAAELSQSEQREQRHLAHTLQEDLLQLLTTSKLSLETFAFDLKEQQLRDSARRVMDRLEEAIAISRTLTERLSPPMLDRGLPAALRQLAAWMKEKFELEIALDLDEQADPQTQNTRHLLFQAGQELLFNVLRHSGVRQARLSLSQNDGRIELQVADDGRGFDPEQIHKQERERFGLFSLKERLQAVEGVFQLTSAPQRGTLVRVTVPLQEREKPRQHRKDAERPRATTASKIRILLVDDHAMVREGLKGLLDRQADMEVIAEADNGEEAIKNAFRLKPDVIIMDVSMPGISGIEATRRIKSEHPEIRVIGLSMYDQDQIIAAMRKAGASDFLTKGGASKTILAAIRDEERSSQPLAD